MTDYDKRIHGNPDAAAWAKNIHSNPDAAAWAKFFVDTIALRRLRLEDIDESLMIGWFANAMMAMHDHVHQSIAEKKSPEQTDQLTRFDLDMDGSMEPSECGRWVRYEDICGNGDNT